MPKCSYCDEDLDGHTLDEINECYLKQKMVKLEPKGVE